MSFLNALASDGLSVGLRFYNAKMNGRAAENASARVAAELPATVQPGQPFPMAGRLAETPSEITPPLHNGQPENVRVLGLEPQKAKPPKAEPTAEELAAGRAEAKAMLGAEGSLGQLAAAQSPPQGADPAAAPAPEPGAAAAPPPPPPPPAGGAADQLTPEEQQEVDRLKAREAQIKAEVASSVQKGVEGAESVRYTYVKGPDDNRYISGIQGGGGQPKASPGQPGEANAGEATGGSTDKELSEEEQQQVADMRQRDQEVRIHEQAHVAAAAGQAGAPVYEYQTGPDGKRYAVGGHVDVRSSGSSDPDVALREAEAVKRAATAPADPSGPDRAAAAQASAQINQLKADKARQSLGNDEDEAGKEGSAFGAKDSGEADNAAASRLSETAAGLFNGSGRVRQAAGAYAAMKLGYPALAPRPVLARA